MNLLIYFQGQAFAEGLALRTHPRKIDTYRYFFRAITERGFTLYVGSQDVGYIDNQTFQHLLKYENGNFVSVKHPVKMDVIFDRSSARNVIPQELHALIFNTTVFKNVCESKALTYEMLHAYMPKSVLVQNTEQLAVAIQSMQSTEKIVLKPVHGMKGEGIIIDSPQAILAKKIALQQPSIVQEFIDTSLGIPHITDTIHDIRMIIINNTCVLTSIRTPKKGSLLANVAQGGSIRELSPSLLSPSILSRIKEVQSIIQKQFGNPFYSIDFGVHTNGHPYIFELNDRIDFPDSSMQHSQLFAEELATALHLFSLNSLSGASS
jgi:glutathione synthase/RimK-type ligase-like ATP-grasp enzyme